MSSFRIPDPDNVRYLANNIEKNGSHSNVRLNDKSVLNAGAMVLANAMARQADPNLQKGKFVEKTGDETPTTTVATTTLSKA